MIIGYLSDLNRWKTIKININYPKMERLVNNRLSTEVYKSSFSCKDITNEEPELINYANTLLVSIGFGDRDSSLLFFKEKQEEVSMEIVKWHGNSTTTAYVQCSGTYSKVEHKVQKEITLNIL